MEAKKTVKRTQKFARPQRGGGSGGKGSRAGRASRRRRVSQSRDARPEFTQKVIAIRRVARVVAGGRRFSFSAVIILGDKNGKVGVGIGKGSDTALAIEKAVRSAKKNMIKVCVTQNMSISHEVRAKYCSAEILIIPVPGKGLVAGSAVRNVLDIAGITDISAKVLTRSKNKLNIAQATIKALLQLS